ncbi:hypothetical protein M231_00116 [Tremella mesenterica]|uniref:NAD-dependent epimerase/dehydratase domain-containing protein n=1 Tax=Tremella mesenterica TaxID=5217 RepID=A0A4Q1BWS5_TREME|nr:hypothetical protein M231_00116 [Tremella mesenterica]
MSSKLPVPDKPLVILILGGTTTVSRPLIHYLVGGDKKLASYIRLVDRFSFKPPTTYLDKPFLTLLDAPSSPIEYKQINLSNTSRHTELFTPPSEWAGVSIGKENFDVVFDLTGEPAFDKSELIQISNTYQIALSLATSASQLDPKLRPGAYVRLTFPFYEMKSLPSSSAGHAETANLKPDGDRGRWWHETVRGIGRLSNLNFGVIRSGAMYGRGTWEGEVTARLVIGHVYKSLNEEMKFLHNPDLRYNTINTIDISQALYLLALYLLNTPRETVTFQCGVEIPFSFPESSSGFSLMPSSKRDSMSEMWKTVSTVVPEKATVVVPLFNVVDDDDATQEKLAKVVAQVWGIKYGFLGSTVASLVQQFAKTDFFEMVEDVNELHVEAWAKMLAATEPPITLTPITPFLDEHAFRKLAICLDSSKARRILGFKPIKPRIEVEELKVIVKDFQDDGLW